MARRPSAGHVHQHHRVGAVGGHPGGGQLLELRLGRGGPVVAADEQDVLVAAVDVVRGLADRVDPADVAGEVLVEEPHQPAGHQHQHGQRGPGHPQRGQRRVPAAAAGRRLPAGRAGRAGRAGAARAEPLIAAARVQVRRQPRLRAPAAGPAARVPAGPATGTGPGRPDRPKGRRAPASSAGGGVGAAGGATARVELGRQLPAPAVLAVRPPRIPGRAHRPPAPRLGRGPPGRRVLPGRRTAAARCCLTIGDRSVGGA